MFCIGYVEQISHKLSDLWRENMVYISEWAEKNRSNRLIQKAIAVVQRDS
jgi:hypothetical protein